MPADEQHRFGGRHTDEKLDRLQAYMSAYTTALREKGFVLVYIDAFAGSGTRVETKPTLPLFEVDDGDPETITLPGSAKRAFETKPPFGGFVLIEKDPGRFAALERLSTEYPEHRVVLENGDANAVVQRLCRNTPWQGSHKSPPIRGLLFLDPYGMEVSWETIEAVARTEAIDMWCFFPLMGLYRQAAREPAAIDDRKRAKLNSVLGTDEWQHEWYKPAAPSSNLLGLMDDDAARVRTADVNAIEAYVQKRLESVFKGVVLPPRRITGSRGHALASLFFATANPAPKAVALAKKIASHVLNSGNSSHWRPR
ncbi:three-Cys-motif partner protein TcmP [Bosea eneae]|uniref:Three-Cys-motif partner protein TcmP n=1 Tax=Bosea eneae TaxID=151454 RepID=A0ABW0IRT4_9HYPH